MLGFPKNLRQLLFISIYVPHNVTIPASAFAQPAVIRYMSGPLGKAIKTQEKQIGTPGVRHPDQRDQGRE